VTSKKGKPMTEVDACRSVLIEVLTILAKDLDKLVVVGGWVPELAFPERGHIGSIDVDLALDARRLHPMAYESIGGKLAQAGYLKSPEMMNRFYRQLPGSALQIRVDLITGEFAGIESEGAHHRIQGLTIWKARGIELAFACQQDVSIEGMLPGGGHNKVIAKMPTIAAFLCIKAITLGERKKEKDAYDIFFCIDNFPGGPRALAWEFRAIIGNTLVAEGLSILREKFSRLDGVGPVWAALVAAGGDSANEDERQKWQRRAFEIVNALLREVDGFVPG